MWNRKPQWRSDLSEEEEVEFETEWLHLKVLSNFPQSPIVFSMPPSQRPAVSMAVKCDSLPRQGGGEGDATQM